MTDDLPTTVPTRQAIAAKDRSAPRKVTGRLRTAIMEMVWKGSRRAEAAVAAGMTDHSLREAFRKSHVKAFYLAELGVLRESERARTFHRLCDLRDQDRNVNGAVAAARTLEQLSDQAETRPARFQQQEPGFVIQIINQAPQGAPTLQQARVVVIDQPGAPQSERADAPEALRSTATAAIEDQDGADRGGRGLITGRTVRPIEAE